MWHVPHTCYSPLHPPSSAQMWYAVVNNHFAAKRTIKNEHQQHHLFDSSVSRESDARRFVCLMSMQCSQPSQTKTNEHIEKNHHTKRLALLWFDVVPCGSVLCARVFLTTLYTAHYLYKTNWCVRMDAKISYDANRYNTPKQDPLHTTKCVHLRLIAIASNCWEEQNVRMYACVCWMNVCTAYVKHNTAVSFILFDRLAFANRLQAQRRHWCGWYIQILQTQWSNGDSDPSLVLCIWFKYNLNASLYLSLLHEIRLIEVPKKRLCFNIVINSILEVISVWTAAVIPPGTETIHM